LWKTAKKGAGDKGCENGRCLVKGHFRESGEGLKKCSPSKKVEKEKAQVQASETGCWEFASRKKDEEYKPFPLKKKSMRREHQHMDGGGRGLNPIYDGQWEHGKRVKTGGELLSKKKPTANEKVD